MAQIAMKYGLNSLTNSEQMGVKPELGIDWNHYNYPPCLKIFNYDREHIPEDLRKLVFCLWLNHILIFFTTLFNFVTNVVATATKYSVSDSDTLTPGFSLSSASFSSYSGLPWDSTFSISPI